MSVHPTDYDSCTSIELVDTHLVYEDDGLFLLGIETGDGSTHVLSLQLEPDCESVQTFLDRVENDPWNDK